MSVVYSKGGFTSAPKLGVAFPCAIASNFVVEAKGSVSAHAPKLPNFKDMGASAADTVRQGHQGLEALKANKVEDTPRASAGKQLAGEVVSSAVTAVPMAGIVGGLSAINPVFGAVFALGAIAQQTSQYYTIAKSAADGDGLAVDAPETSYFDDTAIEQSYTSFADEVDVNATIDHPIVKTANDSNEYLLVDKPDPLEVALRGQIKFGEDMLGDLEYAAQKAGRDFDLPAPVFKSNGPSFPALAA